MGPIDIVMTICVAAVTLIACALNVHHDRSFTPEDALGAGMSHQRWHFETANASLDARPPSEAAPSEAEAAAAAEREDAEWQRLKSFRD